MTYRRGHQKEAAINETGTAGQPNLFADLDQIRKLAEKEGFSDAFFDQARWKLEAVCAILDITPVQAALFTLLLEYSGTSQASLSGIAGAIHCGKIPALQYRGDLEALELKHIIDSRTADEDDFFNTKPSFLKKRQGQDASLFIVPADVIRAIETGQKYRYAIYHGISPEEFYTAADRLFTSLRRKEMDRTQFLSEINFLFSGSPDLLFVKKFRSYSIGLKDKMVLLAFCTALVEDGVEELKFSQFRYLYGGRCEKTQREFESGEHALFTTGLLEHLCDDGFADTCEYRLTDKAREDLVGCLAESKKKNFRGKDIIRCDSIAEKQLYYPPNIRTQIDELARLLQEEHFSAIVQRLKESGMKTGFACLFSGPPGTGKTETAYQIARAAGRDIFFVDISETKSMWFGESEKTVKSLFTRYNALVKRSPIAPVLLFNEADAILGKRQTLGSERRGPAQTENAIQNILLQEIENLRGGILIATTNMADNFDAAFERRFLYKIAFEKPDLEAKAAIWKSILPVAETEAPALAGRFDFSGGQIENVARKALVAGLIRGAPLSGADIAALCEEEQPARDARRIGFAI